jgi:hypothetical protein
MARTPLNLDTSADVEQQQIERWRQMSTTEKAALISGLTNATFVMARAGVQQRHPNASPREVFLRLAVVTLGPELARRAYPEVAALT